MMRRTFTALTLLLCVACFEEYEGSSTLTGDYSLRSVNGAPLPVTTASTSTSKTEIVDDVITLYQGSTYSRSSHTRTTTNGQSTTTTAAETGTFSSLGTSITFSSSGTGLVYLAQYTPRTLTFVVAGTTTVFKK